MSWEPVKSDSVRIPTREMRSAASGNFRLLLAASLASIALLHHAGAHADAAEWPRWLEPAPAHFSVSSNVLIEEPAPAVARTDVRAFELTESLLGWTEHAVRLIQKHQQNPQRAVRALALLHAAIHDAFVLAARERSGPAQGAVAAHRAAGLVLAYL